MGFSVGFSGSGSCLLGSSPTSRCPSSLPSRVVTCTSLRGELVQELANPEVPSSLS